MKIILEFDAQAQSAPAGFEAAMQEAANMLDALVVNNITVKIAVGYGEINGNVYTNQSSASAQPNLYYQDSYSQVRGYLASNDPSTVTALPNTTSISGDTLIDVYTAQAKAFGQLSASASATDGYMGVGTGVPQANWVGVALHELTHAMGRSPGTSLGPDPDIFDLFRFLSPGNRLLASSATPSQAAYFSLDGGKTDLADYGINSDPSDFLNPPASELTPNDPYNEYYPGANQYLTTVDLQLLDALGFSIAPIDYWQTASAGNWLTAANWSTEEPGASDRVTVAQGTTFITSTVAPIYSLTVSSPGEVVINAGASLRTTADVVNNGQIIVEETAGSFGSPSLSVGGALFNDDFLQIGNSNDQLGYNAVVTAFGLGRAGTIDLFGGSVYSATLSLAGAAGFGTVEGVLNGTIEIVDDASIVFGSGEITSIGSGAKLTLSGAGAGIDDQGSGTNSALTGLANINGLLVLEDGASLSTSGALDVSSGDVNSIAALEIDAGGSTGGSRLQVNGGLTNSESFDIGSSVITSAAVVAAQGLLNTPNGTITIIGDAAHATPASLVVSGSSTNAGQVFIKGGGKFINSGGFHNVSAGQIFIADDTGAAVPSSLSVSGILSNDAYIEVDVEGLLSPTQDFYNSDVILVQSGGSLDAGANLYNSGKLNLDTSATSSGGSELSVVDVLVNSGDVQLGNATQFSSPDTLTVGQLSTSGAIEATGYDEEQFTSLDVLADATNFGAITLTGAAAMNVKGDFTNQGTVTLDQIAKLTVGGTLTNSGAVTIGTTGKPGGYQVNVEALDNTASGTISFMGSTDAGGVQTGQIGAAENDGSISVTGDTLLVKGAVTGGGTIALDGNAELELGGANSNTIAFSGADDLLKLDSLAAGAGVISGFGSGVGDVIDLVGETVTSATFNADNTQLTVDAGGSRQTYYFTGVPAGYDVLLTPDGSGGTDLSLAKAFHWASAGNNTWDNEDAWSPSGHPGIHDIADIDATGAPYTVTSVFDESAAELNVAADATLAIADGKTFTIGVRISNAGVIAIDAAGDATTLRYQDNGNFPFVLAGGGDVVMSNDAHNAIVGQYGDGESIDNVDNTISGAGTLGGYIDAFGGVGGYVDNEAKGVINADDSNALTVSVNANAGLLEDTGTGGLELGGAFSGGGTILASGAGAHVDLGGIVSGQTLETTNGGVIDIVSSAIFDGEASTVVTTGLIDVGVADLYLKGAIANSGTFSVGGTSQAGFVFIGYVDPSTVTLTGGGEIELADNGKNLLDLIAGSVLDNVDNTISGSGIIEGTFKKGVGSEYLTNEAGGVIDASGANGLLLKNLVVTNDGLLEATGTGGLQLSSSASTITGSGVIEADGPGAHVDLGDATITGGTLRTTDGGTLTGNPTLDGSTAAGPVTIDIAGTLDPSSVVGAINVESGGLMTNGLTVSAGQTIRKTAKDLGGVIHAGAHSIVNNGVIYVDDGSLTLEDAAATEVVNNNLIEASGSGTLSVANGVISGGGTIEADGAGANVLLNAVTLQGGWLTGLDGGQFSLDDDILDGTTSAGAVNISTNQALIVASVEGSLNFASDGRLNDASTTSTYYLAVGQLLEKSGGGGLSVLSLGPSNVMLLDGTVKVLTGALELKGGGYLEGDVSGAGTLEFAGGADTWTLGGNASVGGIDDISGALNVTDDVISGSIMEAQGAGSTIEFKGVTLRGVTLASSDGGVIAFADDSVIFDGTTSAGAVKIFTDQALTVASVEGSLNFAGDGSVYQYTSATTAPKGYLLAAGQSLEKSGGDGVSRLALDPNSFNVLDGSVEVMSGTLELGGGGLIGGDVGGAGTLELEGSWRLSGSANVGAIVVDSGGGLLVTGALSSPLTLAGGDAEFGGVLQDASINSNVTFAGAGELTLDEPYGGVISGFGSDDSIDLANIAFDPAASSIAVAEVGTSDIYDVTVTEGSASFSLKLDPPAPYTTSSFVLGADANGDTLITAICYCPGTHILTPTGEAAIETLRVGDFVVTRFGGIQPIKWIGRQSFAARFIAKNLDQIPVRIRAGALGPKSPARDLFISPGHSMLVDGRLALAKLIVNGVTVTQDPPADDVHYYQIELEGHDCVIAEGAWSETYADGPGLRNQFHNAAEFRRLYPDHVPVEALQLCAPRPERGPELEALLRPLAARAAGGRPPGELRGSIDAVLDASRIEGWAQDVDHPDMPVELEIWLGPERLGSALACERRWDLAEAGVGRGHQAFYFTSAAPLAPDQLPSLRVCRAGDGAEIVMSADCRARIAGDFARPRLRAAG